MPTIMGCGVSRLPEESQKRSAPGTLLQGVQQQAAKVKCTEGDLSKSSSSDHVIASDVHLTITFISGDKLCDIVAQKWAMEHGARQRVVARSWSIARVKECIRSHLSPDQAIQALLHYDQVLKDDDTLSTLGIESDRKAVLQVVTIGLPRVHLFEPCSARELSERRGCSRFWQKCGSHIVADGVEHCGMDTAPTAAQEVANDMHNAAPDLKYTRVNGGDSDENGEIIVIANAGDDPKLACFKALGFITCTEDYDLWKLATLDKISWSEHLNCGFNSEEDSEDEEEQDGLLAITRIMAERLSDHFMFNFTEGVVIAPVIYGGYTSDGSIVGVLSARVWT